MEQVLETAASMLGFREDLRSALRHIDLDLGICLTILDGEELRVFNGFENNHL